MPKPLTAAEVEALSEDGDHYVDRNLRPIEQDANASDAVAGLRRLQNRDGDVGTRASIA